MIEYVQEEVDRFVAWYAVPGHERCFFTGKTALEAISAAQAYRRAVEAIVSVQTIVPAEAA